MHVFVASVEYVAYYVLTCFVLFPQFAFVLGFDSVVLGNKSQ